MKPQLRPALAFLVLTTACATSGPSDAGAGDAGPGDTLAAPRFLTPEIAVRPVPLAAAFGSQNHPAVAFGANEFLVVWQDTRGEQALYATRVDLDGRVVDPLGFRITSGGEPAGPSVVFDGTDFLVVWTEAEAVKGQRVSPEGRLVSSAPLTLATAPSGRRLAHVAASQTEGTILVAWIHSVAQGSSQDSAELWGARIHSSNGIGAPFLISSGFMANSSPAIASGLSEFLVAWATNQTNMVELARVPLGEGATITRPPGFVAGSYGPKVAFDGQAFIVAWSSPSYPHHLYASRLSDTEHPVQSSFLVAAGGGSQTIAGAVSLSNSAGLVWFDRDISTGKETFFASTISSSARPAPPTPVPVSSEAEIAPYQVASARGADRWLVVWADARGGPMPVPEHAEWEINGMMLDSAGQGVGVEQRLSSSLGAQVTPSAAFDGQNYLVAWSEKHEEDFDLYGARLSAGGQWLEDPFPISAASNAQSFPAVAFDGSQFVVVWRDFRERAAAPGRSHIYGARVSKRGEVLDPQGIAIEVDRPHEGMAPAIAAGGGAVWLHWQDPIFSHHIAGARVYSDGGVSGVMSVHEAQLDAYSMPATVFDGKQFVVTWGSLHGQWAARVSPDGSVLDAQAISRSPRASLNYLHRPAAASNGAQSFLIWSTESQGLVGARIGQDGKVLEDSVTLAMPGTENLGHSVAFDGQRFVVLWEERVDGQVDLMGRKVSPDNFELEPAFAFTHSSEAEADPVVVAGGAPGNLLLAYTKAVEGPSGAIPQLRLKLVFDSFGATFDSTPPAIARCGQPYAYAPSLSGADSYRFALHPGTGDALPDGLTVDEAAGLLSWTPSPTQSGHHAFVLWAFGRSGAASQIIDARVSCDELDFRQQFLGCTQSGRTGTAHWAIALACLMAVLKNKRRGSLSS